MSGPEERAAARTSRAVDAPDSRRSSRAARPGYRWAVLSIGVFAQASFAAVFFGIPVIAPALRVDYGLTLGDLGVVLASVSVGMLVTVFPWGILADRIGERAVMASGLGVAAVALGVAASSRSFPALVAALVVAGAFGASVQAASGRAVMGWFDVSERGFALGIRQTAVVAGSAAAAVALPFAVEHGGSRTALLILAAGVLAAASLSLVGLRQPPSGTRQGRPPLRATLENRLLWRLCLGGALLVVTQVAVLSFAVIFLHEHRGLSARTAAGVLAIMQVIGGALRILVGRWSDRLGRRSAPLVRLSIAVALALAATAALVDAPLVALLPVFVAAGALSASWNGLAFTAAGELAGPAAAGGAIGLQQASLALSTAVTPVAFVAIVETASWTASFATGCIAALLATAVFLRLSASERAAG